MLTPTFGPQFSRFVDGHNYTRRSLRDRILMGMFAVNVMYSVGLVIPMNLFHTDGARCGTHVISSSTTIAASLGLFLGSKYAMVLYEVFIVGASLLSLKTGRTELPRRVETTAHATCVAVGMGMFVGWTAHWAPLMTDQASDLKEGNTAAVAEAGVRIAEDVNANVMTMMRVWVAVLAVVIGLWGWSRFVLRQLERDWDDSLVDANQRWDRDRKGGFCPSRTCTAACPTACFPSICLLSCVGQPDCAILTLSDRPAILPQSRSSLEQERSARRRPADAEAPAARPAPRGLPRGRQATRTL